MHKLFIDIGNSCVKAILDTDGQQQRFQATTLASMLTALPSAPDTIWISDVSPADCQATNTALLQQTWQAPVHHANLAAHAAYLPTCYAHDQLGIDRWLAMLACYQQMSPPFVLIDYGTAVTLDVVDASGVHQGGYILPGLLLMQSALQQHTGITNMIPTRQQPHLAQDTGAAIEQGCQQAIISLTHQLMQTLPNTAKLCLSGGHGKSLLPYLQIPATYLDDLVLHGLIRVAQLTTSHLTGH
jgi:type III pantothenate kinase